MFNGLLGFSRNGFELKFEDHRLCVYRGSVGERARWGFVWTRKQLTLAEEVGFATFNDCMQALWREVFKLADEYIRLKAEEATRIVRGETK